MMPNKAMANMWGGDDSKVQRNAQAISNKTELVNDSYLVVADETICNKNLCFFFQPELVQVLVVKFLKIGYVKGRPK